MRNISTADLPRDSLPPPYDDKIAPSSPIQGRTGPPQGLVGETKFEV